MTPEEYQRIKEAEKEHLRQLKKLKEAVRLLKRRQAVNQALEEMATGAHDSFDVHEEMVDKLALETARHEAHLEIALEEAAHKDDAEAPAPARATETPEALEEDLLKERAKTLLRQMKQQMGTPDAPRSSPAPNQPSESTEHPTPPEQDLPEKTLGRMKP